VRYFERFASRMMGILKEFTKFYIIDGGERLIAG
jgi:hypothetical protein